MVYRTEEEQLEEIKAWWKRYGSIVTMLFSILLLAFAGYKYWSWHHQKVVQEASNTYERLMVAFSNKDNKGIQAYANVLAKEHGNSVYGDAAHLILAKYFVSKSKYKEAKKELEYVAVNSKDPALKQIAKIRIARILIHEKTFNKALENLTKIDDPAYLPVINELKGDIYAATGQYQQAIVAYRKAIEDVRTQGMGNLFLEMKTNELAAHAQLMKTKGNAQLQSA